MIAIDNLTFAYGPGTAPVFAGFSWRAAAGERWAVIGPSGCGKSTLLLLLAGLLKPQRGSITVDGQPLAAPCGRTGLVLQDYELLPWATVLENVTLGLRLRRCQAADASGGRAGRSAAARQWLERLGIAELAARYPHELSGGQRQRTAIARTLVLNPRLLLMDEPFSALDAGAREALLALSIDLCSSAGITLVMVTHSLEDAVLAGERILVLGGAPGSPPGVLANAHPRETSWRASPAFAATCNRLRDALGDERK